MKNKSKFLPVFLSSAIALSLFVCARKSEEDNFNAKIPSFRHPTRNALLLTSGAEPAFAQEFNLAYDILQKNGFKKDNIFILSSLPREAVKRKCVESMRNYPLDAQLTKYNLEKIFQFFSKRLTEKDFLFVFARMHGTYSRDLLNTQFVSQRFVLEMNSRKASVFDVLGYTKDAAHVIDASEFAGHFKNLKCRTIAFIASCYSKAFAEKIREANSRVTLVWTAGKHSQEVFYPLQDSCGYLGYSLPYFFFSAFDPANLNAIDVDNNRIASIQEAVNYASISQAGFDAAYSWQVNEMSMHSSEPTSKLSINGFWQ